MSDKSVTQLSMMNAGLIDFWNTISKM